MPAKQTEEKSSKIQFFGEVDLSKEGKIISDMPAWYFDVHIADLEEGVAKKERALERGTVKADQIPMIREQVKAEREKLKLIERSRPNLNSTQENMCYKVYQNLERQIKDSMPTRKQAKDGLVNPQQELKRLKEKHITINPEVAAACGVHASRGKVTGDEANKCYQILGRALKSNTNVEALRKDGNSEAYQTMHDLTQAILKGKEVED
jgi:tellurite resistance protein